MILVNYGNLSLSRYLCMGVLNEKNRTAIKKPSKRKSNQKRLLDFSMEAMIKINYEGNEYIDAIATIYLKYLNQ